MSLSNEDIVNLLEDYNKEAKALKSTIFKLAWFMRGGMTLDEAFALSFSDRELISQLINENLETAKETGMPFF